MDMGTSPRCRALLERMATQYDQRAAAFLAEALEHLIQSVEREAKVRVARFSLAKHAAEDAIEALEGALQDAEDETTQ